MSQPRFFYNNDGSFLLYSAPPLSPEDFVYEAVGRLFGTRVDAVVCHMFGFGDAVPLYPTDVPGARSVERATFGHVSVWRQQETLRQLWAGGCDPWQLAVDAAHAAGMQYWAGMRFNDLHGGAFQVPSEFRDQHPEYVLGDQCGSGRHGPESVYRDTCAGMNYGIAAVRDQRQALVEEVCTRYDVDGFEWDFTRENGHHFPDLDTDRPILTEYLRRVRAALRAIGERRGRPLGFGIRVPGTIEKCWQAGLDVETWIRDGIIDYIVPASHWDTATDLPFDTFVELARGTECGVYACTSEQVGPGWRQLPPAAALRAGAYNAWQQGVDGIYLFNFHHQTLFNVDDTELFHQLGDPAALAFKDKLYVIAGCFDALKRVPNHSTIFQAFEHQLPRVLEEQPDGPGITLRLLVGDDLTTAARRGILDAVTLEVAVLGLTSEDSLEFKLNGRELPASPRVDVYHHYLRGTGTNSYNGNTTLCYDLRDGDWIRQGTNDLTVVLRRRNPRLAADLVLHEVTLDIRYRVLPIRGVLDAPTGSS